MISAIYCDFNATTPLRDAVKNSIIEAFDIWHNPSSSTDGGRKAKFIVDYARTLVSRACHANPNDVIFTSGGTEANHLALYSMIKTFKEDNKGIVPQVITSNIEHDSVRLPLKQWSDEGLCEVITVPIDRATGAVRVIDVINVINTSTAGVSIMSANNETGVIQPIAKLRSAINDLNQRCVRHSHILFHTDAAQCLGKVSVDASQADYTTIVGHKFYGPRIGSLIAYGLDVNNKLVRPIFHGGGQERGYRSGTENTPMIAGFGYAADLAFKDLRGSEINEDLANVRDYFETLLKENLGSKLHINFETSQRLPNTSNVQFTSIASANDLLAQCKTFTASCGAACHSHEKKPSRILTACGLSECEALQSARISFGISTTRQDVKIIVDELTNLINN